MSQGATTRKGFYGWLGNTLERRSKWVIIGTLVITSLLILPLVLMAPKEQASDSPTDSAIVKLSDHIEDTFAEEVLWVGFIVEARDGDMLTRKNLAELFSRIEALRASELAEFLYTPYDKAAGTVIKGVYSIADAVNTALLETSAGAESLSTETVTDARVKQMVGLVLSLPEAEQLHEELSARRFFSEETGWTSPALIVGVLVDDSRVLEEYLDEGKTVEDATTPQKVYARETFSREVQEIMRGDEIENQTWGIAIDLEHEIKDESGIAGVMLMAALALMAILLLIFFRSWLIMVITIAGLGMLIVWMKGFSNLIGLKSSTVTDIILPVAIVVLGIDYAIQALFRYREERSKGQPPEQALGNSTFRVGRALVLAMCTTVVAFISNASAGIESVVGFAVAASIAIFSSFILLGLFVPAVTMRWRAWRARVKPSEAAPNRAVSRVPSVGKIVSVVSDRWLIMLSLATVVTAFAAWGWLNVETKMDAKDALVPDSDFVVSLDLWDEHGADKGGEPSWLYFEGDLTQNESIAAIRNTIAQMNAAGEEPYVGSDPATGGPNADSLLLDLLEALVENEYARSRIEQATGVEITDLNGDSVPDTQEQLRAVYDYVIVNGLPQDETTQRYRPQQITEAFVKLESGAYATRVLVGVPGTREQSVVRIAEQKLKQDMEIGVAGVDSIRDYGVTGSGNVRVAQFDAISSALTSSLIIAVAAVLGLLIIIFRSPRYAVITMIPVLLVATWLYGFMYLAGYSLNMLTATIAAISVGVGIDFSIHFTERFREEIARDSDRRAAIRRTAESTGFALFCTALTTAVGFAVIAFAPMPMFSTFGILTAFMIALSLFMALFVLPSLLRVFAPIPRKTRAS